VNTRFVTIPFSSGFIRAATCSHFIKSTCAVSSPSGVWRKITSGIFDRAFSSSSLTIFSAVTYYYIFSCSYHTMLINLKAVNKTWELSLLNETINLIRRFSGPSNFSDDYHARAVHRMDIKRTATSTKERHVLTKSLTLSFALPLILSEVQYQNADCFRFQCESPNTFGPDQLAVTLNLDSEYTELNNLVHRISLALYFLWTEANLRTDSSRYKCYISLPIQTCLLSNTTLLFHFSYV